MYKYFNLRIGNPLRWLNSSITWNQSNSACQTFVIINSHSESERIQFYKALLCISSAQYNSVTERKEKLTQRNKKVEEKVNISFLYYFFCKIKVSDYSIETNAEESMIRHVSKNCLNWSLIQEGWLDLVLIIEETIFVGSMMMISSRTTWYFSLFIRNIFISHRQQAAGGNPDSVKCDV